MPWSSGTMKAIGKDVGAEERARRLQLRAHDAQHPLDRRQAEGLGVRQVRIGHVVRAVAEEPDVVELHLVEALVGEVAGDRGQVLGHARSRWVEPRATDVVAPRLPGGAVAHRQLGTSRRRRVVLHRHHPGDRVDAALLERRQQLLEVEDRRLADRADLRGGLEVGGPVEAAIGLLDVDDHRVRLGPVEEREHLVQAARRLEDRRGRVERAGLERLEGDIGGHAVGDGHLVEPISRHLVDHRRTLRHLGERSRRRPRRSRPCAPRRRRRRARRRPAPRQRRSRSRSRRSGGARRRGRPRRAPCPHPRRGLRRRPIRLRRAARSGWRPRPHRSWRSFRRPPALRPRWPPRCRG